MYLNFGDKNFFEDGILVDTEHSDTVFPMLLCLPYPDEENLYQFGDVEVDTKDTWIDRESVLSYIGMTEADYDPIAYAIGAASYYSWENFGANSYAYDWQHMTKEEISEILKNRVIAKDHLDIV